MKKLLIATLVLIPMAVLADQRALTSTGEEVLLRDDGTWEFLSKGQFEAADIPVNRKSFKKPSTHSFLVKSKKNPLGIWINPKKWSMKKSVRNSAAEYEFVLKGQDLYGMAVTEKVEIPVESLANIAVENARNVAPDIRVVSKEYRNVNGRKVLQMQMSGSMQGIKLVYLGYYFSDEKGSTQLITYTSKSLFDSYRSEAEKFLNGMDMTN